MYDRLNLKGHVSPLLVNCDKMTAAMDVLL